MNISQLLEALKDPSASLTISEKLIAGVSVAILSMTVVFIVLVLISIIINLLQRENKKPQQMATTEIPENTQVESITSNNNENMEELVSVITAAIAAATNNSTNNIVVRKIVRNNNTKTSWESMTKNTTK